MRAGVSPPHLLRLVVVLLLCLPRFALGSSCDPGEYCLDVGCIECAICQSGRYKTGSNTATSCTACDAGRYIADDGNTVGEHNQVSDCDYCTPPNYNTASGQASCDSLSCPAGATWTTSSCTVCPEGRYQNTAGLTSCIICASGKYNPNDNSGGLSAVAGFNQVSDCVSCDAGRFISDNAGDQTKHDAESDCTYCSSANYQSATGANNCATACPAGATLNVVSDGSSSGAIGDAAAFIAAHVPSGPRRDALGHLISGTCLPTEEATAGCIDWQGHLDYVATTHGADARAAARYAEYTSGERAAALRADAMAALAALEEEFEEGEGDEERT